MKIEETRQVHITLETPEEYSALEIVLSAVTDPEDNGSCFREDVEAYTGFVDWKFIALLADKLVNR